MTDTVPRSRSLKYRSLYSFLFIFILFSFREKSSKSGDVVQPSIEKFPSKKREFTPISPETSRSSWDYHKSEGVIISSRQVCIIFRGCRYKNLVRGFSLTEQPKSRSPWKRPRVFSHIPSVRTDLWSTLVSSDSVSQLSEERVRELSKGVTREHDAYKRKYPRLETLGEMNRFINVKFLNIKYIVLIYVNE